MNSNQISKAVRLALVAGAVSAVAAPAAFAADDSTTTTTTTTNNQSTAQLGKIEVTGTRIKRTDVETAQPVTILTSTQLKQTGLTSIGDILQTVTQAGAALNTTFNNGGNGSTNIDLRFLGANRVLVLVNGRRWTPALNGTVDLNTIPVAIIDHVEILQDGASAIYGSDAIAGVINIITVKSYNGAEANAYTSIFDGEGHHDGKVQEYDFTIGSSGDKAGVVLNVGYVNQHEVWAGARDISKEPIRGEGLSGGSSSSPNGRFVIVPFTPGTGRTCGVPGASAGTYGTCDLTLKGAVKGKSPLTNFRDRTPLDAYNFAPLNYFITPSERTSFYAQGHYDLADNLTFTSDVLFNKRNSAQALASSPLTLGLDGGSFVNGEPIGIGKTNIYNPFGITLNGNTGTLNPGTQDLLALAFRRPVEAGQREFNQNVETSQFSGAFKGYFNLGGNEWDWDVGYTYGDTYETDLTSGLFNTERLATALDSPGVAPCSSQPNCVPFNFFGGAGSITPAMLNYVLFEAHDASDRQMRDYTGNINGSLFDLPAGPVGLAIGYEYLEFNGFSHPDATTSSGNTSGNVTQPTDGREKTNAEYIEFDIPLVADAPGFKMLDLDIADRWSQFKWFGGIPGTTASTVQHSANASTARAALKWQPTDSLLIRASWSQGFRIPSLSELFFGASDSFPGVTDPCAAAPGGWDGVPADFPKSCAPFTAAHPRNQPNAQIRSTVGGNANLTPEHATSKSIGFVYNPDFVPGFDFSVDYYHIELDKEVTAIPPETLLQGCFPANNANGTAGTSNPIYCSKITVKGNVITDILDLNLNIGGIVTDGIDVAAHYKFPSTSVGDFKLGLDWTFLKSYQQITPNTASATGFTTLQLAGDTTGFGGFPKQRANVNLSWNYGDFSAAWNMEYIHAMYEGCNAKMIADLLCSNIDTTTPGNSFNHLGNTIYHDVTGTYHMDDWNTDFTIGIRNLLDKAPPTADTAFANSFLPAFYRVPGRQLYGRISVKF
jgi:iron complex outermembrane receptor protein